MQSAEDFKLQYCQASNISAEQFDAHFVVRPCICGDESCQGYAAVSNNELSLKAHKDLYERETGEEQGQ